MMNLKQRVQSIKSRADLVAFVAALAEAHEQRPDWWENDTLASFLEALGAWVEDMEGAYANRGEAFPEQPTWKTIGEILYAATRYE